VAYALWHHLKNNIERLEKGEFNLVAAGRALLQDSNSANKVKHNQFDELKEFSGKALTSLS
jgi:2,4-dienoyl-CoA reductase-like NADH-dependent reductase (Old Yellow Enzyme family)